MPDRGEGLTLRKRISFCLFVMPLCAHCRKQYDSSPRFRYDNIISLDMDMPEKTTQDFEGPGMSSKVDNVLGMHLHGNDEGDEVIIDQAGLANPYLHYPGTEGNANEDGHSKPKSKKKSSDSSSGNASRPKSAARRK